MSNVPSLFESLIVGTETSLTVNPVPLLLPDKLVQTLSKTGHARGLPLGTVSSFEAVDSSCQRFSSRTF